MKAVHGLCSSCISALEHGSIPTHRTARTVHCTFFIFSCTFIIIAHMPCPYHQACRDGMLEFQKGRVNTGFQRARTAEKQVKKDAKIKSDLRAANANLRSGAAWEKEKDANLPESIKIKLSKKDSDILKLEEEYESRVVERVGAESSSGAKFLEALGKRNERYDLTIVELGMELMQLRLSGINDYRVYN